jgi:hypothetical protein
MMRRAFASGAGCLLGALAFVGGTVGCTIEPIDISDRQCDEAHPCAAEYTCVDEICERNDELDDAEAEDAADDDANNDDASANG